MTLPLEGLKVIDLGYYLPAAYCTQILGDMGADVLKVEEPIGQGPRRGGAGVSPAKGQGSEKIVAHNFFARNKRSIILNLKSPEAVKVFLKLAEGADVVVENMRPGVTKRLGIDYESLRNRNAAIIYCAISGYGQDSPYVSVAGHDPNYCSIAGAQALNIDRDNKPVRYGIPLADIGTSLHAAIGILLAVVARGKTGKGQFVDISMTDSVFSFVSRHVREWLCPGAWPVVLETLSDVVLGPLEVKNGEFITVANIEPYFWERFCKALGVENLIGQQYSTGKEAADMSSTIKSILLTKTRNEWFDILSKADTTVAPVLEPQEVLSDAHILHRQLIMELDHPVLGKVKQLGFPIKLSETPAEFRTFAPVAGQHTEQVLGELGYTPKEVAELRQNGAVQLAE